MTAASAQASGQHTKARIESVSIEHRPIDPHE